MSWHHAVLRVKAGRRVVADSGSSNGTFAGDRRVDRVEISGECLARLGDPADGPALSCAAGGPPPAGTAAGPP